MLRIAICDDMPAQRASIEDAVKRYFQDRGEKLPEIVSYGNPLLFLESLDKTAGFDILLLDVCMPGINGIQVAEEVRRRKDKSEIIFLTTSDEFAVEAFALKAVHYLVKPFTRAHFCEAMERAMERFAANAGKRVTFYAEGGALRTVDVDEILYIESCGHSQTAYLNEGTCTETRRALSRMQEELNKLSPGQFASPCKGFLVNQKAICTVEPKGVTLRSGQTLPLARGSFREFSSGYFAFLFPGHPGR